MSTSRQTWQQTQERLQDALQRKKRWEENSSTRLSPLPSRTTASAVHVASTSTSLCTTSAPTTPRTINGSSTCNKLLLTPLIRPTARASSAQRYQQNLARLPRKPSGVFAFTESRTILYDRERRAAKEGPGPGTYLNVLTPILNAGPASSVFAEKRGRGSLAFTEKRGVTFDRIARESRQSPGPSAYNTSSTLLSLNVTRRSSPLSFSRSLNERSLETDRMNKFGGMLYSVKSAGKFDVPGPKYYVNNGNINKFVSP